MNQIIRYTLIIIALLLVNLQAVGQYDHNISNASIIRLKNGAKFFGEIVNPRDSDTLSVRTITGDVMQFDQDKVKKVLWGHESIIARNDQKYVYINYFSIEGRFLFNGLGSGHFLGVGLYFKDNFKLGLMAGGVIENFDFGPTPANAYSFSYYFSFKNIRPYAIARYVHSLNRQDSGQVETFGNNVKFRNLNLGVGIDVMSRKRIKFDFDAGLMIRHRVSSQQGLDRFGNPLTIDTNTFAYGPYFSFGFKINLAQF